MKSIVTTGLSLLFLFGLVGCGSGGQSSASLQVSRAFAMTNPKFGGGLIITGKKLNSSQSFSVSLDSSTSTKLSLEKGLWLIAAVGWDGGTAPEKVFAGDTYCGWTQANLDSDSATIELEVTKAKCADTSSGTNGEQVFALGHVDTTGVDRKFKALNFITTCNSFFTSVPTSASSLSTLDAKNGFSTNYCNSLGDLTGNVKSMRVFSVNQSPSQVLPRTALDSGCIKNAVSQTVATLSATGNPFNGPGAPRLPYNNIPFIIQTYEEDNCTKPLANFHFKKGLGQAHSENFDHELLSESTTEVKLLLPGNDVKRARSPFAALLPSIKKYNSGSPLQFQTVPSSLPHFRAERGVASSIILEDVSTCASVSPSGDIDTTPGPSCTDLGDKVRLDFIASGTGDGTGSLAMSGATYQIYFEYNAPMKDRFDSQKTIAELLGNSNSTIPRSFFWPGNEKDNDFDKSYGAFSEIREMLITAGSVIGISGSPSSFAAACTNSSGSKEIEIFNYDRMSLEKYKVIVENALNAPSSNFCNIDNPSEDDCASNGVAFNKRMSVFDYKQSPIVPMMVFEFNCSALVGKMEVNSIEIEGVKKHQKNQIISWNTELGLSSNMNAQRFELLQIGKEATLNPVTSVWNQVGEYRRLSRFQKIAPNDYEIWNYESGTHKNLSNNWDQIIGSQQLKYVGGQVCYTVLREGLPNNSTYNSLLNSNTNQSVAPSVTSATNQFGIMDSWGTAVTACSSGNYTDLVINDTNTDGLDDYNADKFNGALPFELNSLRSSLLDAQFGGTFFNP